MREGETDRMQTLYYGKRLNAVFNCRAVSGRSQLELYMFVYIMLEYGNITTWSRIFANKPPMIRRDPTLIPMTDLDVQDVRDVVTKQKAEMANHQALIAKMKRLADNPLMTGEDMEMYEQLKEGVNEKNKARRLGLDAGELKLLLLLDNPLITIGPSKS